MTDGFASSLVLASLDAPDADRAFGSDALREDTPPAVTDLVRSAVDTRVWATTAVDVATGVDRGDFVVFHRARGVRAVAQVWGVSADEDDVRRLTDLDDEALADDRWAVLTLTNVQPAKNLVALAKVGLHEVARAESLYRIEDVPTLATLRERYTAPTFMFEAVVADPLAFDVPPSGDPAPPPKAPAPEADPSPAVGSAIGRLGDVVETEYATRDAHAQRAGFVSLFGLLGAAAVAGAVAAFRELAPTGLAVTPVVAVGLALLGVGTAGSAGIAALLTWRPRPGLAALRDTHRRATAVLGTAGVTGRDVAAKLRATELATAEALARRRTRVGVGVGGALLVTVVGLVYLAYGVGVQVSPSLSWAAPLALVLVPVLVGATFAAPLVGELAERFSERFENAGLRSLLD